VSGKQGPSPAAPAPTSASSDDELPDELLLLGIDGGGTKTIAVLALHQAHAAPRTIGRGTGGPANPRAAGWATVQQHIADAIDAAFATAGRPRTRVAALCLGMAGAGHASVRETMYAWCAQQQLAERWAVVHDAQIILRAGAQQGPGIALISGTGSLAYGVTADGHSARAGGWGYLLGDEGSGYAIGLAALRAMVRETDGRAPATQLTASLLPTLGVPSTWDLIPLVHEDPGARRRIASLAPLVLAVAEQGDAVAQQIRDRAARELTDMVAAVSQALALGPSPYQLVFSGGLLQHHPALREAILQQLAQRRVAPQSSAVADDPACGAVLLARNLLA